MKERLAQTIQATNTFKELAQLQENGRLRGLLTAELQAAIDGRSGELGRRLVREQTGLKVDDLSPAEEKIIRAVSEYVGIKKRQGRYASRTLLQLKNRGLLGAAEAAVSKTKPTQGFTALADANLEELSYERIVVDHPDEFSARAVWYSRRTLGLPNDTGKPPANSIAKG